MYLSPKYTAAKARLVSVVGTLVVYSDMPQMQDLLTRLQGSNPRLVLLQGEISVLSFGFAPTSVCAPPSGISSPPRQEVGVGWGSLRE